MAKPDIFFSFFMFTPNLKPTDPDYVALTMQRIKDLAAMGFAGFDLPIAPGTATTDFSQEVENYQTLRQSIDESGLGDIKFTTNVAAFPNYDPSSDDPDQRAIALSYLKSRVDITKALGATAMAGPIVIPYGGYPKSANGAPIWSDDLQDWQAKRLLNAAPVLTQIADYAAEQQIKVAIEPVDHWETPGPNLVGEVVNFLDGIPNSCLGACIDSAHVALGSESIGSFNNAISRLTEARRLHYVHISAPDRGAIHDSWIPWERFLKPIRGQYSGPYLLEVFNAIPIFVDGLRMTRRRFWRNEEDAAEDVRPSAYDVAQSGISELRSHL